MNVILLSAAPFLVSLTLGITTDSPGMPEQCVQSINGNAAAKYRKANFAEDTTPLSKQICPLNFPSSEYCEYWRVTSVTLLKDDSLAQDKTESIRQFIKTVSKYCDKSSEMVYFTPTDQNELCLEYETTSDTQEDYLNRLTRADTVVPSGQHPGVVLEHILNQLKNCTAQNPFAEKEAGALFFFTDFNCEELCEGSNLGSMVTDLLFNLTYHNKYVVRIYFLEDLTEPQFDCLKVLFAACALQQTALCDLRLWNNATDFLERAESDQTCPSNADKITTLGLILAISIPCVIVTVIVTCLAVICIRHRLRKKWFHFWFEHTRQTACSETDGAAGTNDNDYHDIERLREHRIQDLWEINPDHLEIHTSELLGTGAFASVFKGKLSGTIPLLNIHSQLNVQIEGRQGSTCDVAVKKLPNHADQAARHDFFQEMEFMKKLGYHLHIISLVGCVSSRFQPLIVVEYAQHGDLLKFIRTHKNQFTWNKRASFPVNADMSLTLKDLLSFSWQISDGMVFLSSSACVHRDVAARNTLLTKNLVAKIGDFGLCREVDSMLYTAKGGRLPIKWMAPESLKYYEYSTKSDVWSFGILLFELFSLGEAPFSTVQPADMPEHLEQGNRLQKPKHCPDEIYALMEKCWQKSPEDRPGFVQIRDEITRFLNAHDEQYGYLPVYLGQGSEKHKDTSEDECYSL